MERKEIENEIVSLTKKLIRFESTKEKPDVLYQVVGFCESYFLEDENRDKFTIRRFERNDKPSLVVTLEDTKKPDVLMIGHLDVVEGDKEMFEPKEEKGKLYGRGSYDMKGSDALMMLVLKEMAKQKNPPSLGLVLTTDEEVGGFDGVRFLFNEEGFSCRCAFVPDGGKDFQITIEEKGLLHLRISTKGQSAHASRPWLGENAIDKLMESYQRIRKAFPNPKKKEEWTISLNAGKVKGGDATNKVAGWAELFIDIRYPASESPENIIERIKRIAPGAKIEVLERGSVFSTSKDNPYLQKYHEIAEQVLEKEIPFSRHPAASDARFLSEKKIPVVLTDPKGGGAHAEKEWVEIEGLVKLFYVLKEFLSEAA